MFASRLLLLQESGEFDSSVAVPGLEKLQRYLKLFLDSLSLGVILVESDQKNKFCIVWHRRYFGNFQNRVPRKTYYLCSRKMGIDPYFALKDNKKGARNRFAHVSVHTKEGDKLITMVTTPVGDLDGKDADCAREDAGYIILFEDLKEARAEEERIERIERLAAAGELAAAISHEVKNPLTVIKGAVSLVPERLDDAEFLTEFSEIVSYEIDRIDGTIESLLNFSRFSQPQRLQLDVIQVLEAGM